MASRRVARYLQELHSHFNNNTLDSPGLAQQVVLNLSDVVLTNLTNEEQGIIHIYCILFICLFLINLGTKQIKHIQNTNKYKQIQNKKIYVHQCYL